MQRVTRSEAETQAFAEEFAGLLKAGDCLAFTGGMGAGKTAFVRGLAKGLNVTGEVSSPTFALVHEYPGQTPLVHFDCYRIHTEEELYTTGFDDYLECGAILALEWSENIRPFLPEGAVYIDIETIDETTRRFTITGGDHEDTRFGQQC